MAKVSEFAPPPPQFCRKLFEDMVSRAPALKGMLLPALVQHTKAARSGFVKADGIALLLAFLRSCANKVGQTSMPAGSCTSHKPVNTA